jgi:hypothetical protein
MANKSSKHLNIIKDLNLQGYTDSEIARKLNLSSSGVNYLRNKLGLKPNWCKIKYKSNYDKMKGYIIRNIKFSAKRRNIHFDLSYLDLELPERCPLLNVKLEYNQEGCSNNPNHATVDRIDNSKGYIKGNVLIISRLANSMKNEANFEQLLLFSKNIEKLISIYKIQGALGNITDMNSKIRIFNLDS